MIAKLTTKLTACSATSQPSNQVSQNFASAANPAESTSDTSSRNPMPRIMPKDSSRPRSSATIPDSVDFGTSQMRSRSDCSSPNTVVAPMSNVTTPAIAANVPWPGSLALLTRPWIAVAPSSPISPRSCAKISPRAASAPNAKPATAIAMTISGAIEKIV